MSNSSSERVHKANYQQVVDDVPLARHYSFSSVEPSPEHKIVVEFAGQCDQPDDYFQLTCVDETWSQKIFLREAEFVDQYCKEVVFSGWLPEVKRVNLTRHCRSHNSDKTVLMSVIYQDIELTELL
nr:hypothetical protein [Vibrio tasmaniensis]